MDLQARLDDVEVTAEVFRLRPDYRALLLAVDGLESGPSDAAADAALRSAEAATRAAVGDRPPEELPHVAAWRDGISVVRGKAPAHPQQPRGAAASVGLGAAAGRPAHRPL